MGDERERPPLPVGTIIDGNYSIIERTGRGGMADVYLAEELPTGRQVALKVMTEGAPRSEEAARFRREARALAGLKHDNIVAVHTMGLEPPDRHYLVMEYVEGETLAERVERRGPMSPATICHVVQQIANALAEAHEHRIVHRDLKPSNIMLTTVQDDDHVVKIIDFGIAKLLEKFGSMTHAGAFIGSPSYAAPEQAQRLGTVDERTDVYALGVIAYELVTSRRPHAGNDLDELLDAVVHQPPLRPSDARPDLHIPPSLDAALLHALAKAQNDRPPSALDFADELVSAIGEWARGTQDTEPGAPATLLSPARRSRAPSAPADPERAAERPDFATVVCMLLESDPLSAAAEPREQLECLRFIQAKVAQIAAEHGGRCGGAVSDHSVLLFEHSIAGDGTVQRALDAAIALRSFLEALRGNPIVPEWFRPTARIAVDSGRLAFANGEGVHGAGISGARRLAELPGPDVVRASYGVYRAVRGLFEMRPLGGDKGHVVLARKRTVLLRTSEIHGVPIEMIGRADEMDRLRGALGQAVLEMSPRVACLTGPPGIGKSRLAGELAKDVDERPGLTYLFESGRCTPGSGRPYEPFAQVIRSRCRIAEDDDAVMASLKLAHFVQGHLIEDRARFTEEDERLTRNLLSLVGLEPGGDASPRGSTAARRKHLFDAVAEYYRRFGAKYPILFVLEDFQWASDATRDLLAYLLEWLRGTPALFVVAERTSSPQTPVRPLSRDGREVTWIPLAALDPGRTRELAMHVLRRAVEPPAALIDRITELSAGIPRAIEETVMDLVDEGEIVVGDDRWYLRPPSAPRGVRLSDSMETLFAPGIRALEERERNVLSVASVVGNRFWPSMLIELAPDVVTPADVAALHRRGFFSPRNQIFLAGEPDYRISRVGDQAMLYGKLPRARLIELHRSAAAWLERRALGADVRLEALIASHFREAQMPERAMPYALHCAERALKVVAIADAVSHLTSYLEMLSAMRGSPERDRRVLGLSADLVQQLVLFGQLSDARSVAARARKDFAPGAADPVAWAKLAVWQGWEASRRGEFREALSFFEEALAGVDETASIQWIAATTGKASMMSNLEDSAGAGVLLSRLTAAFAQTEVTDDLARVLSAAHRVLGTAELRMGDLAAAERDYETARKMALSGNGPAELVDALNCFGLLHLKRGEMEAAERAAQAALAEAGHWDLLQHKAILLTNIGELEWRRGALSPAIGHLERAEGLHLYLDSSHGLAETYHVLGECQLALAEPAAAVRLAKLSLERAAKLEPPRYRANAEWLLARALHEQRARGDGSIPADDVLVHAKDALDAFELAGMSGEADQVRAFLTAHHRYPAEPTEQR
jgi:tetratricopeptide (TPR) repeat protein